MIAAEVSMAESPKDEIQRFSVGVTWSGDGKGGGEVSAGGGTVTFPIGGSTELGGCGKGANPEELLLASVGACFVNTWAIFLAKLQVTYREPALRVTGELGRDPAGGFKMLSAKIHARVPSSLMAERKAEVEKTLQLAEKYCITSKVARAAMPLEVVVEEV
jgi:organic hydroperoxide reductase OsmC/OhrA